LDGFPVFERLEDRMLLASAGVSFDGEPACQVNSQVVSDSVVSRSTPAFSALAVSNSALTVSGLVASGLAASSVATVAGGSSSIYDLCSTIGTLLHKIVICVFSKVPKIAPPPNRAPVVEPLADKSATVGTPISFTVRGSDPDGDTLTWSATGLPSGASFNAATQTFSWTPTAAGTFNVTFTASDGKATASTTVKITVAPPPNRAPVVEPLADKSATVGQSMSFVVRGSDPDGDALTWSATGLPGGAAFNAATQTFLWTPTAAGTFNVTFTANDGKAAASTTVKIIVAAPPPPPPPSDGPGIGQGATSAFHIDRDGDGYGVASPLGPDADDHDPAVNTLQDALAKYGTLNAFLHHLGYDPLRIFYISPAGNDATGTVDDIDKPYKTYTDPQFRDVASSYHTTPGKFNFRLQPTSPAVNAGSAARALPYDLRYTPRVGPVDIGAYEYIV